MNYVVIDEYDDNVNNETPVFKNKKINNNINVKKIIIILILFHQERMKQYFQLI
mgnify:CR=1 FL=1